MAITRNIGVFGTATRSNTLLVIYMLEESHASEIASVLGKSLSRIQSAIESLERASIIVGVNEGNTRRVKLNQSFVAVSELKDLLNKLGSKNEELQKKLAIKRRRPRRTSKTI